MDFFETEDTIAAMATPPGVGGIGIIRISGAEALAVARQLFLPGASQCSFASHHLYYGKIADPQTSRILDEVMLVYMAAPRTYTREDVVEIHCHGSSLILDEVLELILARGARLAEPGEFTKRAFLGGRIDLTQAEAVIDILAAKTKKGVDLAQAQLSGSLYRRIMPVRDCLMEQRAILEVAIDFPEDDVEIVDHQLMAELLRTGVVEPLEALLAVADKGRIIREGISMVIAGLPNVGKSSLLNTILREERALVTAVPGTTRDSIEETVDIGGIPVRIIDTAGIRDDAEEVEELGIRRAKNLINNADLVLFLVDGSRALTDADCQLYNSVSHKPLLVVVNKGDLCGGAIPDLSLLGLSEQDSLVLISAKQETGIEALRKQIFRKVVAGGEGQWEEDGCAPNTRHKQSLIAARDAVAAALAAVEAGLSNDLIAVELQECLEQLAQIVGETSTEDILDVVFSRFCIGK